MAMQWLATQPATADVFAAGEGETTKRDEGKSTERRLLAEMGERVRDAMKDAFTKEAVTKDAVSALNLAFQQVVGPTPGQESMKATFQLDSRDEAPAIWRCSLLVCGETFIGCGSKKREAKHRAASIALTTLLEDDRQTTNSKKENKVPLTEVLAPELTARPGFLDDVAPEYTNSRMQG